MKELSPELVKELRLKANQIRRDICITTSKLPYAHLGGGAGGLRRCITMC